MFISQAWAQAAGDAGGGGSGGGLQQLVIFLPIIAIMYLLVFRPQQQKAKKHKQLVAGLRRGDRVVTQGGILATVAKVINEGELQVEIAEGVRVRILRNSVTDVLAKPEPLSKSADDKDADGAATAEPANDSAPDAASTETKPSQSQGIAGLLSRFLGGK